MKGGNKKRVNINLEKLIYYSKITLLKLKIYNLFPRQVINFLKRITYYIHQVNVKPNSQTSVSDIDRNLLVSLIRHYKADEAKLLKVLKAKENCFDYTIYDI